MIKGIYINGELAYCEDYNSFKNSKCQRDLMRKAVVVVAIVLLITAKPANASGVSIINHNLLDSSIRVMRIVFATSLLRDLVDRKRDV